MSQLWHVIAWWLVLQLFGLAVLPATLRVFRNLPDAGWAFARPVGLLFVGFLFWHGATFGLLSNAWPSILGAILIVAALSWALGWREAVSLPAFLRERRPLVVATEALFTLAFLAWVGVRAFDPDITATEKPMELLFLNGVLRSEQFPPIDPWLSGYAISYYYFGYLITGMIARLAAVPAEIAFNLMLPTLFAMTATGAFAVGSALARSIRGGLLASAMVLLVANLEPLFEVLNSNRLISPALQQWLEIKDMPAPHDAPGLFPGDNWWWFRATRVVGRASEDPRLNDYTINEFPFFSFILGDMHPHVLALPFLFVAVGFALNLLRSPDGLSLSTLRRDPWFVVPLGVLLGGIGFLNTWDMPTMLFVLAAAFALHRLLERPVVDRRLVREVLYGAIGALVLCVLLYLPFYLVFRSQASGFLPVITKTQLKHFVLFWGPMYLLTATFLLQQLSETWQQAPRESWTRSAFVWGGTVLLAAIAIVLEAPVVGLTLPLLVAALALANRHLFAPALPAIEPMEEAPRPVRQRSRRARPVEIAGGALPLAIPREHLFALLLAFTGLLLIMGTELVFIRDHFGNRMNTVFKLYYQAWMLLALAGAYAVPFLVARLRGLPARVWGGVLAALFAVTLLYPIGALLDKTDGFSRTPTLDGIAFWGRIRPDELPAVRWLQQNVQGTPVIVEATGGSYRQEFGRFSSMTGLPTLLGWEGHEGQWRGKVEDAEQRKRDLDTIYRSTDQRLVLSTMAKYRAEYLAVGQTERETYGRQVNLDRYGQFMDVAYKQGSVTIYRVRGA